MMHTNPQRKVYLAFLWHMHQPYYKDDISGEILMPWVYLHAIKDYYEILWYLERFPHIRATFNMAPSLVVQIQEYESLEVKDRFLQALRKPVCDLSKEEKKYLLCNLFHANVETMIKPLERYYALYLYRNKLTLDEQMDYFGEHELLDLEINFLLAWCGNYLREKNPTVKRLLEKAAHFDEHDKQELLVALANFISTIIPFYKRMQDQGQISITTTPYYHPILPLLCDMNNGKAANERTQVAEHIGRGFRGEADVHVKDAYAFHENIFGKAPAGVWPAEGSVSNEALEILSDHGFKYAFTDEEILFKTLKTGERRHLYKRYQVQSQGREIGLLFRDKFLSDRIGFVYGSKSAHDASADFLTHLANIYESNEESVVVPVILDGENAWENYWENGKPFFEKFYSEIGKVEWLETLTIDQVFSWNDIPEENLQGIEPGSWISGDFGIWLGEPEENRAWSYLYDTKKIYERHKERLDEKTQILIEKELMIAEGSDWFWWYGHDHYTPIKGEFDMLFRRHLINVYNLLEILVPSQLMRPIMQKQDPRAPKELRPLNQISAEIDGLYSSFFEWEGSGMIELVHGFSTMNTSGFKLQHLRYGMDDDNLYLAIEGNLIEVLDSGHEIDIQMHYPYKKHFRLPIKSTPVTIDEVSICTQEIIEVKIPFEEIQLHEDRRLELCFSIYSDSELVERAPLYSSVEIMAHHETLSEWYI